MEAISNSTFIKAQVRIKINSVFLANLFVVDMVWVIINDKLHNIQLEIIIINVVLTSTDLS